MLLSGVGEVCGGGVREEREDLLRENIREMRRKSGGGISGNSSIGGGGSSNSSSCSSGSISSSSSSSESSSHATTDLLDWYVDLRRFGNCPHGGFGVGFERYLQAIMSLQSIRDALPFPRAAHLCRL